jgi:ABC-type multidrug transport system permease subunit
MLFFLLFILFLFFFYSIFALIKKFANVHTNFLIQILRIISVYSTSIIKQFMYQLKHRYINY